MVTTISATTLPASGSVRLRVSALTEPPLVDVALGRMSTDSANWERSTGVSANTSGTNLVFLASGSVATNAYARRLVKGHTVGQRYRVVMNADPSVNTMRLGVVGMTNKVLSTATVSNGGDPLTQFVFEYVATAVDHYVTLSTATANSYGVTLREMTVTRVVEQVQRYENLGTTATGFTWSSPSNYYTVTGPAVVNAAVQTTLSGTFPNRTVLGLGTLNRTQTGLVVGRKYRVASYVTATSDVPDEGQDRTIRTTVDFLEPESSGTAPYTGGWTYNTFVATATSHTISLMPTRKGTPAGTHTFTMRLEYQRVDLLPVPTGTDSITAFTRSDVNGVAPVRLQQGQVLSGGSLIAFDSEAALVGPVTYTVESIVANVAESAATTVTFDGTNALPRINAVQRPGDGLALSALTVYRSQRSSASNVFEVIGRSDPIVSLGVLRSRTGTVEVWCSDYPQARALELLAGIGEVLQLRQPDHAGMDMYMTSTSVAVEPFTNGLAPWRVTVEYVELSRPTGPVYGSAVWTLSNSFMRNPTLAQSRAEFPTLAALAAGPGA